MQTKYTATSIDWDKEGQKVTLPDSVEIPDGIHIDDIGDYLSDEYGFTHFGFSIITN